jgi:hypothetical protein
MLLQQLENYINNYNISNGINLAIDSIRIDFSKQYKKANLDKLGVWQKVTPNSKISSKLKKRLSDDEITSAYQLMNYNIYYFNKQSYPHYRKSTLVIFGLSQYDKEPPPKEIIIKLLEIMKAVTSIDICFDFSYLPNIENLKKYFILIQYRDSYYCNNPNIMMIEKFILYDKALKNNLKQTLYRIEFKVLIHNIKDLYLPLDEIKDIIALIQNSPFKAKVQTR